MRLNKLEILEAAMNFQWDLPPLPNSILRLVISTKPICPVLCSAHFVSTSRFATTLYMSYLVMEIQYRICQYSAALCNDTDCNKTTTEISIRSSTKYWFWKSLGEKARQLQEEVVITLSSENICYKVNG